MSDPPETSLRATLEALLFAAPEPLTPAEIREVLPDATPEQIERELAALSKDYEQPGRGVRISFAAGGYRITTRREQSGALERLFQSRNRSRMSQAALETLAVVAYRQPITGPEIQELRGVNSQGVLKTLLDRRLIRILGRKAVVGRPLLYGTTRDFLLHFELGSLTELPKVEELQEALPEPAEQASLNEAARQTAPASDETITVSAEPAEEDEAGELEPHP
ncbi:MAG: SMC-Scp complex subunit ScpB [Acidobacteriota bacterium]